MKLNFQPFRTKKVPISCGWDVDIKGVIYEMLCLLFEIISIIV
ncbi:hypothetical protein HDF17_000816 [Granulicella arctica]|uniref:Uncharacterized protein n=1 Tax=Granulicella arctica TaxID=940613 RepID=A0A7Y9PER1_9BACT|nr:hypothetical protein [Granulicella arctica]